MDIVLLLIVAASGLCAVSSHVGRQYHFVYERKNMTEAQSYCREKYTDLATIDNMEEVNILNNMADLSRMVYSAHRHTAWIGLYDDVNSWRWSLSDRSAYKDGEWEFRQWGPGQPNNGNDGQHCTAMNSNGLWSDNNCETRFKAVCITVRGPSVYFFVTDDNMTWTEAQSYCREHHTDLASIRDTGENQKVRGLVPKGEHLWIGLFRDSWKWSDGSNSSFRYWRTGEPNGSLEACVAADFGNSGKWEDWNCDFKRAFICYSPPTKKQVFRLRLKKNSALDLNDPAVMEEMLKQLKQKLKDQGLNEDVKLSWKKQSDGKVFHQEKETKKKKKKKKTVKTKEEL